MLILWAACRCTVHRRALPTRVNLRRNEPLRRRCLQRAPFACLRCGATAGMLLAAIRPEVTGDLVPARSCLPDGISSSSRLLVGSLAVSSQRLACKVNSAHGSPSGRQGSARNLGQAPSRHCDGAWRSPRRRCSRQSCGKRALAHAVAAATRTRAGSRTAGTSRASESIPNRRHRVKTTPQQGSIKFPLTCLTSLTRSSIRPYSGMIQAESHSPTAHIQKLDRRAPAAD